MRGLAPARLAGGIAGVPRLFLLLLQLLLGLQGGDGGGGFGRDPFRFLLLATHSLRSLTDHVFLPETFALGGTNGTGVGDDATLLRQFQQPWIISRRTRLEFLQEVLFGLQRRIAAFDEVIVLEASHTLFFLATTRVRAWLPGDLSADGICAWRFIHVLRSVGSALLRAGRSAQSERLPRNYLACAG